jgi:thioredoxin reductase (NADPH)
MGPELMTKMRAQAERFGAELITDDVSRVDFSGRPLKVYVNDEEYRARAVIIATGATARQLGLDSEVALQGRGVSYCAVCDAAFCKNQNVIVVGGGDSAMEEASFVAKFAEKVTVVHRRGEFRASKIMIDYARSKPNVDFILNSTIEEILGLEDGRVVGVRLRNVETGEDRVLETDSVFVAIGHDPTTALFRGVLDMDEAGYLLTRPGSTATNVEGVFAAGDVVDHVYRQAVTAAGMGCQAALDAERWLSGVHEHEAEPTGAAA